MNKIISNDNFNISKDKRTPNLYTIEFNSYSETIIKSLIKTKIIIGASVSSDFRMVRCKALSIQSFKKFQEEQYIKNGVKNLSIPIAATLLSNLSHQMKYLLISHSHCFIGYNPENIIVIDGNKFAYLGSEHISEVEDENILLSFPFSLKDFFLSPEQTRITELPSYIHYKTAYYSLACLIIHTLTSDDYFIEEENDESFHERITTQLDMLSIKGTKLYYLLKRCLEEDPKERSILFI